MAPQTFNFTTGPSSQRDVGLLSYNGCSFSPLFSTEVLGTAVKDDANRTTKYMEYTIKADGYVTLPDGATSTAPVAQTLRTLLTAQGGGLIYEGRGCDIIINFAGRPYDVAWGPEPKLLEFQPLGAGRCAKVQWQVTVRIPEVVAKNQTVKVDSKGVVKGNIGLTSVPLLQFSYETSVTYGEDGFSTVTINGVLEIPITRTPGQSNRTIAQTADDMRGIIDNRIMAGIDLRRFHVTRRNFTLSKDKRLLTWMFQADELPHMDLPPGCTVARGSYNVRPAQSGMGMVNWLCTLRGTYTVRQDSPRRTAWFAFLIMLQVRMNAWVFGDTPKRTQLTKAQLDKIAAELLVQFATEELKKSPLFGKLAKIILGEQKKISQKIPSNRNNGRPVFLVDFSIDEGMYLDSKTITFSATWRLVNSFAHIMLGSGIWRVPIRENTQKENLWAISMRDIQGSQSWSVNKADPSMDVIVDFGGP